MILDKNIAMGLASEMQKLSEAEIQTKRTDILNDLNEAIVFGFNKGLDYVAVDVTFNITEAYGFEYYIELLREQGYMAEIKKGFRDFIKVWL